MLSEDKFYEKSAAFVLYPTVDDKFYTLEELKENLKKSKLIRRKTSCFLYAGNKDAQHSYIEITKEKMMKYLDSQIISHLIQKN
jgi:molecular chaperone HtpG